MCLKKEKGLKILNIVEVETDGAAVYPQEAAFIRPIFQWHTCDCKIRLASNFTGVRRFF